MVKYENSKILSVGDVINKDSIFATTTTITEFLKDMRKKYIKYKKDEVGFNPIFDIINNDTKPSVTVLIEQRLKSKDELNALLDSTKKKYTTLVDVIKANRKDIKEITTERYDANLKVVMQLINITDVKYFEEETDATISSIMLLDKSQNTKKNYIKSIMATVDKKQTIVIKKYIAGLRKLQDDLDFKVNNQVKPEGIEYKTPEQLNEITNDLLSDDNLQDAVISVFYTGYFMPVNRLMEIYSLKTQNYNTETDNFIDFTRNELVFNNYKTAKNYGKQMVKFTNPVKKLFIKLMKASNSDFLIVKDNNLPYNEVDFSKKIKNIFGCSVNNLRSMYFTHAFNSGLLYTEAQKQKFAIKMRNSVGVFKYYVKF